VIRVRPDVHEIEPVSVDRVVQGQDGSMIAIDGDVGNVVADLRRLDPTFRVRFMERGNCYVVYQRFERPDGRVHEHFCFSVEHDCFDQRVVRRAEKIMHESYDPVAELDRNQAQIERDRRERIASAVEAHADELHYALRRDLGAKDRIFVPA